MEKSRSSYLCLRLMKYHFVVLDLELMISEIRIMFLEKLKLSTSVLLTRTDKSYIHLCLEMDGVTKFSKFDKST